MTNKKITEDVLDRAINTLRTAIRSGDRPQQQKISNFLGTLRSAVPQTDQPGQSVNRAPTSRRDRERDQRARDRSAAASAAHDERMNAVMLQQGDSGPEVEDLQTKLNRFLRNSPLTVDGEYGPTTAQAVRTYQQSVIGQQDGLEATGNLDGKTNASLINRISGLDRSNEPRGNRSNRGPRTTPSQPSGSMGRNINRIVSPSQGGGSRRGPNNISPSQPSGGAAANIFNRLNQSVDRSDQNSIQEGLADLADRAERDHEVQMARSDLYKLAKYAIKLHEMLKTVSEAEGIEGWQQAKITKAADYISSVYHALDYDMNMDQPMVPESAKPKRYKPALSEEQWSEYKGNLKAKFMERATSQNQQQAAGIALKHKREGTQPEAGTASAEMMSMSVAELEKLAGTKHKGLPKSKS